MSDVIFISDVIDVLSKCLYIQLLTFNIQLLFIPLTKNLRKDKMKFLYIIIITAFFMSCQPKEVKVPVNDNPGLHEVWNNSPIYILQKIDGQDTIADLKLGQTISTTKWLVAVEKSLVLKQLLPALEKVYKKRRKVSLHSDGKGELYFAYVDSVQKKMSFVEATKLVLMPDFYTSQKYFKQYQKADPEFEKWHLYFYPDNIVLNDSIKFGNISKKQLLDSVSRYMKQKDTLSKKLYLNFDKRDNFDRFLDYYTFFKQNSLPNTTLSSKIFIFTP